MSRRALRKARGPTGPVFPAGTIVVVTTAMFHYPVGTLLRVCHPSSVKLERARIAVRPVGERKGWRAVYVNMVVIVDLP